jgi:hypothetical protein
MTRTEAIELLHNAYMFRDVTLIDVDACDEIRAMLINDRAQEETHAN